MDTGRNRCNSDTDSVLQMQRVWMEEGISGMLCPYLCFFAPRRGFFEGAI